VRGCKSQCNEDISVQVASWPCSNLLRSEVVLYSALRSFRFKANASCGSGIMSVRCKVCHYSVTLTVAR
jgi:hypothetical protein